MKNSTDKEEWHLKTSYAREDVDARIKSTVSRRGWQNVIRLIKQSSKPFEKLKVAEVGCGTGTFSLTLALLGAKVTLIDYNESVLEEAFRIYKLYGCHADCVKGDCCSEPPDNLKNAFDIALSGGLAEHFTGENRQKCISYHKALINEAGFIVIGVPNILSPGYRIVRLFRTLTGTWRISLEKPFSKIELEDYARKLKFERYYVLGNVSLQGDIEDYSLGLVSAVVDILPGSLAGRLRELKRNMLNHDSDIQAGCLDAGLYCRNAADSVETAGGKDFFADNFSAGIILFAFGKS